MMSTWVESDVAQDYLRAARTVINGTGVPELGCIYNRLKPTLRANPGSDAAADFMRLELLLSVENKALLGDHLTSTEADPTIRERNKRAAKRYLSRF